MHKARGARTATTRSVRCASLRPPGAAQHHAQRGVCYARGVGRRARAKAPPSHPPHATVGGGRA
eukprot:5879129-Prymnesium_polylepis.1